MGATSPGRWQAWQFCCKMGRTSLLNVADAARANVPIAQNTPMTFRVFTVSLLGCESVSSKLLRADLGAGSTEFVGRSLLPGKRIAHHRNPALVHQARHERHG